MIHRSRFLLTLSFSTLRGLAAVAALTLGLVGCASQPPQPDVAQPLPLQSFYRAWSGDLKIKNDVVDRMFIRNDMVFVYTKKGISYVLSRETGLLKHVDEVPGGSYKLYPPVVLRDWIVYPTTNTLEVFGLNGGLERTIDLRGAIRTEAVGERNTIYVTVDVPNGGTRVRRLDLTQRMPIPIWELQPFHGAMESAPAVNSDIVYAADHDGLVYAVAGGNRDPVWGLSNPPYNNTFDARAGVEADLRADDNGVYVATLGEGRLYCLNRINGSVKWQYYAGESLLIAPVVTSDTVYLQDPKKGMLAINKTDDPEIKAPQFNRQMGKGIRWASKDLAQILAQDERYTYALRKDGVIIAMDKKTGEVQFTSRRSDFSVYATNTRDGVIYATTKSGKIFAIRPVMQPGQVGELVLNITPADQLPAGMAFVGS